jgi:hypothetical protein
MTEVLPRWVVLPGDPPELTRWLAARREEAAAYEPLPPVPGGEPP